MKRSWSALAATLVLALAAAPAWAGAPELATVESATEVVQAFSKLTIASIPAAMMQEARGVAIVPHVVKAGLVIGGRFGRGVVLTRGPDGTWGDPTFVTLAGGSIGFQIGVQATDVILVFKSEKSLASILRGQGKLTLGGDVSIAAGPVGRQASAATDGQLEAEIYSYSRSRGLFAGASFEGAALMADTAANLAFRGPRSPAEAAAVKNLDAWLSSLSPPLPAVTVPPVQIPVPAVQIPPPPR